jgi:hypothetical protein
MSDTPTTTDRPPPVCGWVKLYHPSGVLVTLPVPDGSFDYQGAFANVGQAVAAGFLVDAPGLEAGEMKDQATWVVRKDVENKNDGTISASIALYRDGERYSFLTVYLDTPEEISAFQYASGLKLNQLPKYVGSGKLEKGKDRQTDQLFTKAPKAFGVVMRANPKHDPNETDATKKKPARLFVRWEAQMPPPKVLSNEEQEEEVTRWFTWLDSQVKPPTLDEVNEALPSLSQLDAARKRQVWDKLAKYVQPHNWVFNREAKRYEEDRRPVASAADVPF